MDLVAYIYTSPRFLLAMGAMALWTWWPIYIHLIPSILQLLEFRETPYTMKNTSKPTKELLDQILWFSTSFVSESARLAQI